MEAARTGSEEAVEQLPSSLRTLMELERFHLHRAELFQDVSRDPQFDTKYFPQNCAAFKLPCFWVRRKYLYVYGSQTAGSGELELFGGQGLSERVLFPVHPTSLDHYRGFLAAVGAQDASKEGLCIWGVPTSSTRTLLAWPDEMPEQALFIKTSLHSPIFGNRRLYRRGVACSVGLSNVVQRSLQSLPAGLGYLPESVGAVPRSMQDSGVIFRSLTQEVKSGSCIVAPLFSLLGGDERHPPLFLVILERSGMSPEQFLEEVLCAQFARLWLQMALHFGLMLESHGQDLMLVLSPDLVPLGRFYYRDFEGLQVDWDLRRQRRFAEPTHLPHAWAWRETYATLGYRYSDLIWWKLLNSLHLYLRFVLDELDILLREWQGRGLIRGTSFEKDSVTATFSRHMMKAVEEMFGVPVGAEYNIRHSPNKFVIFLMKLRRELLAASRTNQ